MNTSTKRMSANVALGLVEKQGTVETTSAVAAPKLPWHKKLLGYLTVGGLDTVAVNSKGEPAAYSQRWTGSQIIVAILASAAILWNMFGFINGRTDRQAVSENEISHLKDDNKRLTDENTSLNQRITALDNRITVQESRTAAVAAIAGFDPATLQKLANAVRRGEIPTGPPEP